MSMPASKIAVALAKAVSCSVVSGFIASQSMAVVGREYIPWTVKTLIVSSGVGIGFLSYVRFFIQGYWFDKMYTPKPDLVGKVTVVTGATPGGLGFASAEILGKLGSTIIVTARSDQKGETAVTTLKEKCGHDRISYVTCDFSDLETVRKAAADILSRSDRLDCLILNAGIGKGEPSMIWQTNQVGPFVFVEKLRPLLESTARVYGDVRVVAVSSGAHTGAVIDYENPYQSKGPYGQSKLAQIMHMRELQKRVRSKASDLDNETSFRCFAITPGFAYTNIVGDVALPLIPVLKFLGRSPTVGAQVIKMACIDPDIPGGSYLSNCYVKPAEGKKGCANDSTEWSKLWTLCEKCTENNKPPR